MASGVCLCVLVLVIWPGRQLSATPPLRVQLSSLDFTFKAFNNETDHRNQSARIHGVLPLPGGANQVPLSKEDKEEKRSLVQFGEAPSEISESRKAVPVIHITDNRNIKKETLKEGTKEEIDLAYQHEKEVLSKLQELKQNIFKPGDEIVKSRTKRSDLSAEVRSLLSPARGTTEVADLLKAASEDQPAGHGDQEVAAGHKSHKWSKGGGHKYKKEHHKKGGHKGDKGYKTKHHHKKGEHEKHGKDEHKKHYKKQSGHKKKHHDAAEKYGEHHKKEKGHKGAKYGEKKGHKKGHKTKGYHHKFHKDEYKKEHKFYDDYHKKGHHDKHGHHHKHHAKKAGKHKKGGHHKSAYHKDKYGKKGHKEGGHYDQEHKGHKGKKGHKKYHEHHSSHGKKGGHKEGKKWGYNKKHKHG